MILKELLLGFLLRNYFNKIIMDKIVVVLLSANSGEMHYKVEATSEILDSLKHMNYWMIERYVKKYGILMHCPIN